VSKLKRKSAECQEGKINILKKKGIKPFEFQVVSISKEK
jgi:hypothetical protein